MARREEHRAPGVDRHGAGWRVRVRFGPSGRKAETGLTLERANFLAYQWRDLRNQGLLPDDGPVDLLLLEAAEGLLARKLTAISKKTGRPLSQAGKRWWKRVLKPWLYGPLSGLPVARLKRPQVEDAFLERAAQVPTSANFELDGIKAALQFAASRGATFDRSILEIEPVPVQRRRRHHLEPDELVFLSEHFREDGHGLLIFMGTVGMRISELIGLDEDEVDLNARTVFVPAGKCKERRDKTIDLTAAEARIARGELENERVAGVKAVFVDRRGRRWNYNTLRTEVFDRGVKEAAGAWRDTHNLPDDVDSPFDWILRDEKGEPRLNSKGELVKGRLQIHDLRATAATMMRDAGLTKEQAAERLGHADCGELLDRIYDQGDRRVRSRVRRALDELAPDGLMAAVRQRAADEAVAQRGEGASEPE